MAQGGGSSLTWRWTGGGADGLLTRHLSCNLNLRGSVTVKAEGCFKITRRAFRGVEIHAGKLPEAPS